MEYKLRSFEIKGLNNYKDILIPFNSNIKLLIGENGTGKTTILNILYYTLSRKFNKLIDYQFEKIILTFNEDEKVEINAKDLKPEFNSIYRRLNRFLNPQEYEYVINELITHGEVNIPKFEEMLFQSREDKRLKRMPPRLLFDIEQLSMENYVLLHATDIIKKHFPEEILYFPTFRRIEEELHNLGYKKDLEFKKNDNLIQFGMKDVEELFRSITAEIKDSTIQGYTEITANMINHLVGGQTATEEMKRKLKSNSSLSIVLDRIGENLKLMDRNKIADLIKTEQIFDDEVYNPLIYFLSNLIDNYEKQRDKDLAIKNFETVCNKYLKNKKVVYNENLVKIDILHNHNLNPVRLSDLSSGEKQIVSLFSKIYLSQIDKFIVLFDEPELSLSIDWQTKLLPDILDSKKCTFLFSVTHSPFIYDNELDMYAKGINLYINNINSEETVELEYE